MIRWLRKRQGRVIRERELSDRLLAVVVAWEHVLELQRASMQELAWEAAAMKLVAASMIQLLSVAPDLASELRQRSLALAATADDEDQRQLLIRIEKLFAAEFPSSDARH